MYRMNTESAYHIEIAAFSASLRQAHMLPNLCRKSPHHGTHSVGEDEAQLQLVADGLGITTAAQGHGSGEDGWPGGGGARGGAEGASGGRTGGEREDHGVM